MSHEQITTRFDEWATTGRDVGMEEDHGDVVRQVIDNLNVSSSARILDLGCGNGWATRLLAKIGSGTSAIGVDASAEMIKRAESLHSYTIRARYECGHFETLDFADGHFGWAFSMEALYYSPDLTKALSELYRVLEPGAGADVVLNRFQENELSHRWDELLGVDMLLLSEAEWGNAFEDAGFSRVRTSRLVDRRGPGEESSFEPTRWCPDWAARVKAHECGSLWVHAERG